MLNSTFRSICAVPNMAFFFTSLISRCLDILLRYCLSDCEMFPVAPTINGITFTFTFHTRWNSIIRSLYYKIFSASCLITFISPKIATSVYIYVSFLLSRTMMAGLLLGMVLLVYICLFHNMFILASRLVSTWSYQCSLSNFTPISLPT